jgi:transitional endoplasmic reticulum ATPase
MIKVAEARQRDVCKFRARLNKSTMKSIGVHHGDIVELIGRHSAPAIAWPVDEDDQAVDIVRIDGLTRKNVGVSLNEYVSIKKVESKDAKAVVLISNDNKLTTDEEFSQFVRNRLKGIPVVAGEDISVMILGNPVDFRVAKVNPKGIVRIVSKTELTISAEQIEFTQTGQRVTYDEVGGLGDQIKRLREIVELPLRHPEVFQRLGIEPPSGVLLQGPPGCGKTLLAKALANESEANFYSVSGPEIMNKYYGETESKLRKIFNEASTNAPSIVFIDEIDAIAPKREDVIGDVEKRVVAQLLALMDGMSDRQSVVIIGATNRPDSVDPALRRPGRFDREVEIGVPNPVARLEILQIHTREMPLSREVNLERLAQILHGYNGADIRALCREAALKALRRSLPDIDIQGDRVPPEILERMTVTLADFAEASKEIVPSALREFYVESPQVNWRNIGGLDNVKQTLIENVIWYIKHPERFKRVGINPAAGLLLYGPSGCGKTVLAQALAFESGANFITIHGPEVLSKWVGESEKAIREIFHKAKVSAPCIVFLDEVDSLARSRSANFNDSRVTEKVFSQLLVEIDGSRSVTGVFVVAATNRPDLLDSSILRPGRLDLLVYVPPPDEKGRCEILNLLTSKMPLKSQGNLVELARRTQGYTGADLQSLVREAGIAALKRSLDEPEVCLSDLEQALTKVKPSITREVEAWYQALYEKLSIHMPKEIQKGFYT